LAQIADSTNKELEELHMDQSKIVIPSEMKSLYDNFHFAPAVKDGDRLYCSGVIGMGPDGKASKEPETQFTHAFESLKSVLTAAGVTFADVMASVDELAQAGGIVIAGLRAHGIEGPVEHANDF